MTDFLANRVHVEISTSGTADFVVGAAISTAYQSFAGASVPDGATFSYVAYTATQFECARGAYILGTTTVDRTAANVVAGSAGAGALTNFSGNPRLFIGPLAEDWPTKDRTITAVFDGGGSAITTGIKGDLEIPYACTISQVTMLADQSGSIVVDIWKDSYANYPPTDADSITASAPPTIITTIKSQDATLTGWTTAIAAGDILRFNVDSAATVTRVTLSLKVRLN